MNSIFYSLPWWVIVLLCGAISFIGCGSSEESHKDEHLEHSVPAHKPKDFGGLVEQLTLRVPELAEGGQPSGSSDEDRAKAQQELSDIIGWIPELAANSELLKANFESAVVTGNKLTTAFAETFGPQTTSFDASKFELLIDELRQLVPASHAQKEQM